MYVVDASVVVKWVLHGEQEEENALKLKSDHVSGVAPLFAPSFLVSEVGNSLWKAVRQKRLIQESAHEALETLRNLNIVLHELSWSEISSVLKIAGETGLTVYDASYLYVSKQINAQIITADDKMYQKSKGRYNIMLLKDYL